MPNPPIFDETEAEVIRERNKKQIDDEAKRRLKIRRAIEAHKEAKELGLSIEEYLGADNESF